MRRYLFYDTSDCRVNIDSRRSNNRSKISAKIKSMCKNSDLESIMECEIKDGENVYALNKLRRLYTINEKEVIAFRKKIDEINHFNNTCVDLDYYNNNLKECFDGKWSLLTTTRGIVPVSAPADGTKASLSLGASYSSRFADVLMQFNLTQDLLKSIDNDDVELYGLSVLNPDASPLSFSLEANKYLYYHKSAGIFHGLIGYTKIGYNRWVSTGYNNKEEVSVIPLALFGGYGLHYTTAYHSRLKEKKVELGKANDYLKINLNAGFGTRIISGDAAGRKDDEMLRAIFNSGREVFLGPEVSFRLRFNVIYLDFNYFVDVLNPLWNNRFLDDNEDRAVEHIDGLTNGQLSVRFSLDSDIIDFSKNEDTASATVEDEVEKTKEAINLMKEKLGTGLQSIEAHNKELESLREKVRNIKNKDNVTPPPPAE